MTASYQPGDIVFAAAEIRNDGSIPDLPEDALIAAEGARGVVINEGHLEEFEDKMLYLVRFENENDVLGPPVGVWPEEVTQPQESAD
jgi:nitrogen fixation protein NifZ